MAAPDATRSHVREPTSSMGVAISIIRLRPGRFSTAEHRVQWATGTVCTAMAGIQPLDPLTSKLQNAHGRDGDPDGAHDAILTFYVP